VVQTVFSGVNLTPLPNLRRSSYGSAAIQSDFKDIALVVINLNEDNL
jgi:hypothetical protein